MYVTVALSVSRLLQNGARLLGKARLSLTFVTKMMETLKELCTNLPQRDDNYPFRLGVSRF